jgi:hypothetical protein
MHHVPSGPRRARAVAGATAAVALLLGLAACAPETGDAGGIAGQGGKGADSSQQESTWSAPETDFDAEQRRTELPEGFPREAFPLPEGAAVYDAGERGGGSGWFVVLLAEGESEASALWDAVIASGGFAPEGEAVETTEGGTALTLASPALRVFALSLPQTDGTVLLSYELTSLQ